MEKTTTSTSLIVSSQKWQKKPLLLILWELVLKSDEKATTSTSLKVSPQKWRKKLPLLLLQDLVPKSDKKSYYFTFFES